MSEFRIDQISNQAGTAGPDIAGITTFSSTSGMLMPSGSTEYRGGRGRGIWGAGAGSGVGVNNLEYVTISTLSNSYDFGDLTLARRDLASFASSTRGCWVGGLSTPGGPVTTNVIDFVVISSGGGGYDFGDLIQPARGQTACSNSIRGLWAGGNNDAPTAVFFSNIEYVTIATTGNATSFGNLSKSMHQLGACASPIRGIWAGGSTPTILNSIEYITISTTGNSIDFGDLSLTRSDLGGLSNSIRGIFSGGYTGPATSTNTIDFITMSSLGDAIDFGDLIQHRFSYGACSSSTRGLFGGGYFFAPATSTTGTIELITIATTGNATSFGNLSFNMRQTAACSDAHGGLGD